MNLLLAVDPSMIFNWGIPIFIIALVVIFTVRSLMGKSHLSDVMTKNPRKLLEQMMYLTTMAEIAGLTVIAVQDGMPMGNAVFRYVVLGILEVAASFLFMKKLTDSWRGDNDIKGKEWMWIIMFFLFTIVTTSFIHISYLELKGAFMIYFQDSGGFFKLLPKIYLNPEPVGAEFAVIIMIWSNHVLQFVNIYYLNSANNKEVKLKKEILVGGIPLEEMAKRHKVDLKYLQGLKEELDYLKKYADKISLAEKMTFNLKSIHETINNKGGGGGAPPAGASAPPANVPGFGTPGEKHQLIDKIVGYNRQLNLFQSFERPAIEAALTNMLTNDRVGFEAFIGDLTGLVKEVDRLKAIRNSAADKTQATADLSAAQTAVLRKIETILA